MDNQILEKLVSLDPPHYRAHWIYWMTVARTEHPEAQRAVILSSLGRFAQVEPELRDEEFYRVSIDGHRQLGDEDSASPLRKEAIQRFPRGLIAQKAKLDEAGQEKDPLRAAELYQTYLANFDENVSWTQLAARDRFGVMAKHPELFDLKALQGAAAELEQRTLAYIDKFGNPSIYMQSLRTVAEALLSRDADGALAYLAKVFSYIQKTWPKTQEFDEKARYGFWPLLLKTHLELKNWDEAIRIGRAFIVAMNEGAIPRGYFSDRHEAAVRKSYAEALRESGMPDAADEQLQLAAVLTERQADKSKPREADEPEPIGLRDRRDAQAKEELLATQKNTPAYKFSLPDIGGSNVSLEEFRGSVAVVSFWATWCLPCIFELDELQKAYERYGDDPALRIVAVSIDTQKEKVGRFVEGRGYRFRVLLSNGTVEVPYQTQPIPKLYVIDPHGNIRFERRGFAANGYFQKELD